MATIVTRSGKGSALTHNEVDANFNNLNNDKLETNAEVRAAVEAASDSNVFTDADHTKLNAIEAGATADQTAAEILTAIKTVDGAGSGLDADTLDGVEASALLPLSGGTMTGNLAYGDNVKATFGNSADLQVFHDGLNSYITDGGTGNLMMRAGDFTMQNPDGSETLFEAVRNGAVKLWYDAGTYSNPKLQTTATGVDVTGTITANALNVTGTVYNNFQRTNYINNGDWYDGVNWEWVWGNVNTNNSVWYKVADMVWPTNNLYDGGGFLIELITNQSNYGSSTEVASNHYNLAVNVSAGTAGSPDEATFTGTDDNNFQLRAIKTAAGVYELQIKCTIAHRFAMLKVQMTATAALTLTPTSSLVAGSTSGTAYLPAESGLATRLSHRFQRVEAATLAMGDNNKATFGDSDDLQIYHNGLASYISDQGSGNLVLGAADSIIFQNAAHDENMLVASQNGAVSLYYDNAIKLATTSGGAHVTGALSATTSMTVQNANGTEGVVLRYNENGGEIALLGTSGNTKLLIDYLDNDDDGNGLGRILNLGAGSTGVQLGIANASNTGGITFTTGNNVTRQHINSIGDIFSYATDGSTIGMFWDASANALNFSDNSKATFGAGSDLQIYHDGFNSYVDDAGTGALILRGNSNVTMRIDSSGAVTKPLQPAFLARPASQQDNFATNTTVAVAFGTEVFDQNADFSSNTFTAPVTGKYQLNVLIYLLNADLDVSFYQPILTTSNRSYSTVISTNSFDLDVPYHTISQSVLADMDAGDTASVGIQTPSGGADQADVHTSSYFSGYLVA